MASTHSKMAMCIRGNFTMDKVMARAHFCWPMGIGIKGNGNWAPCMDLGSICGKMGIGMKATIRMGLRKA